MSLDTIFALSTPPGSGAVAVVRISGCLARSTLAALAGSLPEPRKTVLRTLHDPISGTALDRALVFWHEGPASFTGEDVSEIHTHGSPAVVKMLLSALGALPGLRLAEPGEFTRRAFLNGRMTLLEAEGLADLVRANTIRQQGLALHQASGAAGVTIEGWRAALRESLAKTEAALDFGEDAPEADVAARNSLSVALKVRNEIAISLRHSEKAHRLRDGFRVVLCGPPNSGKSSLFNRLAGAEMAIVAPTAGTTRDLVRADLDFGGLPVTIVDSAGLRVADDLIEREGMRRSREAARGADLVIWVSSPDSSGGSPDPDIDSAPLWVWNKSDLGFPPPSRASIAVSCYTGLGLDVLRSAIAQRLETETGWGEAPVATRLRHRRRLEAAFAALAVLECSGVALELIAESLRSCLAEFDELVGVTTTDDILDAVFREFCIGK